jgi:hypothetical protein
VAENSDSARHFIGNRALLSQNMKRANNFLVKRCHNLDHNAYVDDAVAAKH